MIVKVSLLVAASLAAFAVSQINTNSTRKQSSLVELQDGARMESKKVQEKEEDDTANSDISHEDKKEARLRSTKMLNNVREKGMLSDLARELEQRKVNIQGKRLELYGLKEEKSYLAQLQSQLEEKSAEIGGLSVTLASLWAEKESLKEEIKHGILVTNKLEVAKKTIVEMERKIEENARHVKGRVSMIKERVYGFQGDKSPRSDALIEKKLEAFRSYELVVGKTKRRNEEIELEKRELTVKLLAAQARIASLSHMTEEKIIDKIEDEISTLRQGNEELSRQIEKLQEDRFEMVEELVYQRWLNSCLRFEAQNKENPPARTSKISDLNNNALANSEEKIKSPTSYPSSSYSFSSSHTSSAESDQVETNTIGSSSTSSQSSSRKSFSFMRRITRWGPSCKDDSLVSSLDEKRRHTKRKAGPVRRFSTSMVPEKSSSLRRDKGLDDSHVITTSPFIENKEQYVFVKSSEKPRCTTPRTRRVSFSDHLVIKDDDHDDLSNISSAERSVLGHQRGDEKSSCYKLSTIGFEGKVNYSEENSEILSPRVNGGVSVDAIKSEFTGGSKENKVKEDQMVHSIFAVLGFLLFIFLAYFLHFTTRFLKT